MTRSRPGGVKAELENALLEVNHMKLEMERLKHSMDAKNGELEDKLQVENSIAQTFALLATHLCLNRVRALKKQLSFWG